MCIDPVDSANSVNHILAAIQHRFAKARDRVATAYYMSLLSGIMNICFLCILHPLTTIRCGRCVRAFVSMREVNDLLWVVEV